MFNWNVEDMKLLNMPYESYEFDYWGNPIYPFESKTSKRDKISFVDRMNDGILSKLLSYQKKFDAEEHTIKKDYRGYYKKVSYAAWFKRNHIPAWITFHDVEVSTLRKDLVDTLFRIQLEQCRKLEREYFYQNTEEGQLITEIWNRNAALGGDSFWGGLLGDHIKLSVFGHLRDRKIIYFSPDMKDTRKLTIEELKMVKEALVPLEEKYAHMVKVQEEYKNIERAAFDKIDAQITF